MDRVDRRSDSEGRMRLSPEAEAEINRLIDEIDLDYDTGGYDGQLGGNLNRPSAEEALRAAMRWAYQDAVRVCELHAVEPQVMLVTKITDEPREVAARECAAAIEARAGVMEE